MTLSSASVFSSPPNQLVSTPPSTTTTTKTSTTPSNQSITRLLEDGERINYIYRCARVKGLDTTEGVLLFGKDYLYVVDGYTLLASKDIVEIESLRESAYEPLIPKSSSSSTTKRSTHSATNNSNNNSSTKKTCSKFAYDGIREVHKRRYLLQEIAIELFSNDGRNYLLVFARKCRDKIYERLVALTPELDARDSSQQSIVGQRRTTSVEQQHSGLLGALLVSGGERSVVQRWERGEINNFQYLMCLNTLAGRSYNDLMQYPVFPWIVADYDSPELDLSSAQTFRDLSRPMGAQTPERAKQFEKRYAEWEDPSCETPAYHYGTHYSSAMIVASYLLRMEPFTQIFLRLQGGHFDLADRLFHSVKDNWLSASSKNMADVKELIPEFFYLPEFLLNSNRFDLGKKQSGVVLDDVVLPAWAKGDAREFIRAHRAALESDYVSAHLNEWIDLIFGYKQQGQPATDACNVFHHLFYEGAVNIDEIDDPLKRNAIVGFINNFGQIPKQLFKRPHPTKKLAVQLVYGLNSIITSTAASLVASAASSLQQHTGSEILSSAASANVAAATPAPPANSSSPTSLASASADASKHSTSSASLVTQQSIQQQQQQQQQQQTPPQQAVFIHLLKSLRPSLAPVKELRSQVGQIVCTDKGGLVVVEQNKCLLPPTYQRYAAWGFADESVRIGVVADHDKPSAAVFERVQDGAIFCACFVDARVLVTAGASTSVNVWELKAAKSASSGSGSGSGGGGGGGGSVGGSTSATSGTASAVATSVTSSTLLQLKTRLFGHVDTVTCVAVSSAYHSKCFAFDCLQQSNAKCNPAEFTFQV